MHIILTFHRYLSLFQNIRFSSENITSVVLVLSLVDIYSFCRDILSRNSHERTLFAFPAVFLVDAYSHLTFFSRTYIRFSSVVSVLLSRVIHAYLLFRVTFQRYSHILQRYLLVHISLISSIYGLIVMLGADITHVR
jgi:hypothetical protein